MTRDMRPATNDQAVHLANALELLRKARGWLTAADCPKAMGALQAAIKSAEGAQRHMRHRRRRTDEAVS